MEKASRGTSFKIAACLLVAVFAQTTVVGLVPEAIGQWLGYIDWLLIVVVYVCLGRDPVQALLTAVAAGILYDVFSRGMANGVETAVGVSGFSYVLAAYVADRIVSIIVADNLLVRFATVASASLVNTLTRYAFYKLLKFKLPVLTGGKGLAAAIVFGLVTNLIAATLLYLFFDRIFNKNSALRVRRSEARRGKSWLRG
ncbi:MAG: rod shape-determining protein MreD [Acidobacteria bacterium]|nr:rod shape-determining protein MreD [Acidobacteriota bacterium]